MQLLPSGKSLLIDKLITIKPFRLIWLSIASAIILTQIIVLPMSIYFHGEVTHELCITGLVCSFFVSLVVCYLLVCLISHARETEKRYRRLFEVESDAILLVDCETNRILDANVASLNLYGYTREEFLLLKADDVSAEPDETREAIATHQTHITFRWHRNKSGKVFPVEIASSYFDYQGRMVHVAAIRDITERKKVERILAKERKFLAKILDTTSTLIVVLDPKGAIIRYNAECERLTGISSDHVKGRYLWDMFAVAEDISLHRLAIANAKDMPFINGYETSFVAVDGSERTVAWINSIFCEKGEADCCIISTGIDITDRKALEKELIKAASIDKLTALTNRQALDHIITKERGRAIRYNRPLSLIMFDIDHFKRINDTYGHLVGDSVLREVALLAQAHLRTNDSIGRWGGEEFMVVLPETSIEGARLAAEKLRCIFEINNFAGIKELTASFGVTEYSKRENIDRFIQRVDDALYIAKQEGRNRVVCTSMPDADESIGK